MRFGWSLLLVVGGAAMFSCAPRPDGADPIDLDDPSPPPPTTIISPAEIAETDAAVTATAQAETATAEAAATQTEAAKTPTATPTPEATATPAWTLIEDYSELPDGVRHIEVEMHDSKQNIYFPDSACPLDIAGYSLDVLVENTGATQDFSAQLDLHGVGTRRSWYAQLGYMYTPPNQLQYYCQAYSYNSETDRFWRTLGRARFDEWTNFKIEVVPVDGDWHYAFRYLIDGAEVCYFRPPDEWDGDNRYQVIWRGLEVWLREFNPDPIPIRVQLDNYEGYVSPACGPSRQNP